ncbi:MAG: alpha/beta hydrolase family protein [Candidatus Binatia bacterium]
MAYDPFPRGNLPVGVRTVHWTDPAREDRPLSVEVWYPATESARGRDVDPATADAYDLIPGFPPGRQSAVRDAEAATGRHPLVVFSHGFGSHRRQSTFLCTHLASHGYVVAAVDHTGNTIIDMMQLILGGNTGGAAEARESMRGMIAARPADASFVIDRLVDGGIPELAGRVDAERIGISGHSFGGWTTLATTSRDKRIRAAMPLAPAGGSSPLPVEALTTALDFRWGRVVPTLYLVADRDTLLPLAGMHELYALTAEPKRMVVLERADHMHFCDEVEQIHELFRMMPPPGDFARVAQSVPPISELCPGEHAYLFIRGLGLAHMDAHLKGNEEAAAFLAGDLERELADRGVAVSVA